MGVPGSEAELVPESDAELLAPSPSMAPNPSMAPSSVPLGQPSPPTPTSSWTSTLAIEDDHFADPFGATAHEGSHGDLEQEVERAEGHERVDGGVDTQKEATQPHDLLCAVTGGV